MANASEVHKKIMKSMRMQVVQAVFVVGIIFMLMEAVLEPRILISDWKGVAALCGIGSLVAALRAALLIHLVWRQGYRPRAISPIWPAVFCLALITMNFATYGIAKEGLPNLFVETGRGLLLMTSMGASWVSAHFYTISMYGYLYNRNR